MMEFVEAIHALGGTVEPAHTHDKPISVRVPRRHEAKAKELVDKLSEDLAKFRS